MHNCYFFLSFSSSFSFMGHTLRNDMKDELNERSKIVDAITPGMQKRAVTGSKVILTLLKKKQRRRNTLFGRKECV